MLPALSYSRDLFDERQVRSVTATTRADGEEFIRLAESLGVRAEVDRRDWLEADQALRDLAADRVTGAAVLQVR